MVRPLASPSILLSPILQLLPQELVLYPLGDIVGKSLESVRRSTLGGCGIDCRWQWEQFVQRLGQPPFDLDHLLLVHDLKEVDGERCFRGGNKWCEHPSGKTTSIGDMSVPISFSLSDFVKPIWGRVDDNSKVFDAIPVDFSISDFIGKSVHRTFNIVDDQSERRSIDGESVKAHGPLAIVVTMLIIGPTIVYDDLFRQDSGE